MATAAFKSTSRRPNSSSSSSSSLKETKASPSSPPKNTTSSNKPPPRRSRSVSAVPRSHHETSSLSSSSDFLIKRDNPLYWSNVSPPEKEISESFPPEPKSFTADDRRGRSVSRNLEARSNVSDNRKDFSRILPKVDTGRRRSVSRDPVGRTRPLNSQSDAEGVDLLTRCRNGSDSDGGSSVSRKSNSVRSYSCHALDQVKSLPVSPRGSSINSLPNFGWEGKALGSSFAEADKRCAQRKSLGAYGLEDDASSCIYETVRSEVRRAIADIQNDLESAIIRSSATTVSSADIVDLPPDLVNPGAVELVLDIRRDYARKLEQSQEHARKLRAELEVEEHRGLELSRILKEVLPDPKTSNMRRSRLGRKSSIERRKMSKRLTDEAIAYFDECISLSTFDSSDFDSQDEPPISIVGNSAPIGDCASPYEASTSLTATQGLNSSPNYKQGHAQWAWNHFIAYNSSQIELIIVWRPNISPTLTLGFPGGYLPLIQVTRKQYKCPHIWQDGVIELEGTYTTCHFCKQVPSQRFRTHCNNCHLTCCSLCAPDYIDHTIQVTPVAPQRLPPVMNPLLQQQAEMITWQANTIAQLQAEVNHWRSKYLETISPQLLQDFHKLKPPSGIRISEPNPQSSSEVGGNSPSFTFPPPPLPKTFEQALADSPSSSGKQVVCTSQVCQQDSDEEENLEIIAAASEVKTLNNLFNMQITLICNDEQVMIKAILDTGATTCCIDQNAVPDTFLEPNSFVVQFSGINSTSTANKKLKQGKMLIGKNTFRIPYTYAFDMKIGQDIQMILGCNFLRSLAGGVRIEGDKVTFYKYITEISTSRIATLIEEEETPLDYLEFSDLCNCIFANIQNNCIPLKVLQDLQEQGFIGEDPLRHWQKNQVTCYLDIKNPDLTIEDKPLDNLTPLQKEQYKRHVDALLQLGVIRPSTSRHRTNAFIVNSGTTIDPISGKEVKGKERMVFNYKRLNDLTHKDQYSLPGIQSIIARIGNSKYYSKFDLKSGFHQVAMHPESVPWTAFWVPSGLYEWLVMPFGLKNAPAIFQRKMDNCFRGTEDFIAVYIDDILVFSNNLSDHERHLQIFVDICRKHGLVLSPTKMKIGQTRIEFLGAIIDNGCVQLQPNIISKIADFDNELLTTKKGLRSWLGLLNYARPYFCNMGRLLSPLYAKISPTGERRLNQQDIALIQEIKAKILQLPKLAIPADNAYIVIECDGCMDGWGGICKWKPFEYDAKKEEQICAFASGKFSQVKSTIDAEIHAVMNSLSKFKLYYLGHPKMTIRTDCQAIISFFNKSNQNKPSRVRWVNFVDYVSGCGTEIVFEHVKGSDNLLADYLSRLTCLLILQEPSPGIITFVNNYLLACQEVDLHPTPWSSSQLQQTLNNFLMNTTKSSEKKESFSSRGQSSTEESHSKNWPNSRPKDTQLRSRPVNICSQQCSPFYKSSNLKSNTRSPMQQVTTQQEIFCPLLETETRFSEEQLKFWNIMFPAQLKNDAQLIDEWWTPFSQNPKLINGCNVKGGFKGA